MAEAKKKPSSWVQTPRLKRHQHELALSWVRIKERRQAECIKGRDTLVHKHAPPTQRAPKPAAGEPIGCMRAVQTLKQACFQGYPESAVYVQIPVGSRNSASRSAYHTSLRPSSLFEPRHPSLKVVSKHNHRVAGATSRQYEHNTTGASRQRLVTGGNCHKGK